MKRLGVLVATTCALAVLAQCLSMAGEPAKDSSPAGARSAEATAADSPLVAEKIRQAMQDRDYAAALKAIDEAMAAKDAPHDYLLWLKGRALHLAGQHDEAIAVFESVEKLFPTSPWVRRARFAKGATLARKGDFRAAELVYRAEADYLLSADRKQQIADLYLEFADAYFKPPKEEQKPDYAKALEFYTRALDVGPKPEKRAEVELLVAQCQQKLGKFDEAIGLYEKFIREHPTSPLDLEARYNLGDCQLQKGDRRAARRAWQDLLAKYPDARTDRIAEAAFRIARTWGIPPVETAQAANPPAPNGPGTPAAAPSGPPGEAGEALNLGIAALEAFLEKFPAHKLAGQAHLDIAGSYLHFGRYEDAAKSLQRFLADERYRQREEVPQARYLLGRSFQLQKRFPEALAVWQEYLVKHPAHQAWSAVQREIVDTEFLMAKEKLDAKDYPAAVKLWSEFQTRYPLDARNPESSSGSARSSTGRSNGTPRSPSGGAWCRSTRAPTGPRAGSS